MYDTTDSTVRLLGIVLAAVVVATAAIPAPVVADDGDDCEDALIESLCELGLDYSALAAGAAQAGSDFVAGLTSDTTAEQAASDWQSTVNSNNETIESWVNGRGNASTSADVVAIQFQIDDTSETVYAVATVNNSTYENGHITMETDRSVDHNCTLEGNAARNAASETETFVDEYAKPDKNLTDAYKSRLVGRYGGNVDCTLGGL